MSSTFPSILTTYTNPQATDKLNSPSHSGIEISQNSGLTQVEAVIGLAGASSVVGTIQYDLRSPASNGGGHVQTANKGGTGQTSFTKGDILVGASSSVLSKLAIGSDGLALLADSSQSSGVNWGQVTANLPYAQDSGTGSVYAIAPVPCIASLSPGQIFAFKALNTNTIASPALSVSSIVGKTIQTIGGGVLSLGQIQSSTLNLVGYTGSVFQLLSGNTQISQSTAPARGLNTAYQNTTGKNVVANITLSASSFNTTHTVNFYTDGTSSPSSIMSSWSLASSNQVNSQTVNTTSPVTLCIGNGNYYKASVVAGSPTISTWIEQQF